MSWFSLKWKRRLLGLIGILIVRNTPDLSVDADRYQELAANRLKSGHLDRLAGHLDQFDPLRSTTASEKMSRLFFDLGHTVVLGQRALTRISF